MDPLIDSARLVLDALERNDAPTVRELRSARVLGWEPDDWMRDTWFPKLESLAGSDRHVLESRRVHDHMARFVVAGAAGRATITVLIDDAGMVFGLAIDEEVRDGGFGICIGCDRDQHDELHDFYAQLVAEPLGFGDGGGTAPRWPDPRYPQQMHLDILVPDLDHAGRRVLARGATELRRSGGFTVFADPVGHPFCLYPGAVAGDGEHLGTLVRVVIDCPEPATLARFWAGVLRMPRTVEATSGRIVIAREDGSLPMIALQRVDNYRAPRWPDPRYPAQMHFDIGYDDRESAERLALELGGTRLPPQGGSCPVYADPAGHPFCLCMHGE